MENVRNIWDKMLAGGAAVLGLIGGVFGGWDVTLGVLLGFVVVDYVSGCIVAMMGKSPKTESGGASSRAGLIGIGKKVLIFLLVLVAALLDRVVPVGEAMFRNATCMFFVANEGLSILENMALAGVPFPEVVKNALEVLREGKEKEQ